MNVRAYDFLRPNPFPTRTRERAEQWLRQVCEVLGRRWGDQVPFEIEVSAEPFRTGRADEWLQDLPENRLCVTTQAEGAAVALLLVDTVWAVAMVMGMLGESVESLPEPRPLTTLETAVLEAICAEFTDVVRETWPGGDAPHWQVIDVGPALLGRRSFAPYDNVFHVRFSLKALGGTLGVDWLVPLRFLVERLIQYKPDPSGLQRPLVTALPLTVVGVLGRAELSVAELRSIRPGDVVVLDTAVDGEVTVLVERKALLLAKPVRVNSRQAVQITRRIEVK